MVRRIYVEKKPPLRQESEALLSELQNVLGIQSLTGLRLLNCYDVEGLDEAAFRQAVRTVFSEPQVDDVYEELPEGNAFAVEYLPGQYDQRADSASQCIQLMTRGERPAVRTAKVYLLEGSLSADELTRIKSYVINPVEAREASLDAVDTLKADYAVPTAVGTVEGFTALDEAGLRELLAKLGLAMDLDDLKFLQTYFRGTEQRDPTITEVRVVDTYWSDHCRHTTFSTHLDHIEVDSSSAPDEFKAYQSYLKARVEVYGSEAAAKRPRTLMDMATIGTKVLKKRGLLPELDESEEINACSIHVPVTTTPVGGGKAETEDWLLMFKNETHNHPTEIEPFGGAATCIGGCIRDPLSGRAYVHQAMRVTGAGDPRTPYAETLEGRLPQRKLCQTAAAGYSSYGNQIGLATGHVAEVYHPGYAAKRLECGAVVGAAPASHVRREIPAPGDVVILLGGRTGRDGIGGATGSSKSHNLASLTTMASEVQKGNAPEERKLQRLFRDGKVTRLVKRCNDFGAGGVSVAIGELADGLEIDLDAVRKKYDGLDGTELAISESQERMAVVVAPEDADALIAAAEAENLEAYRVAVVTERARMVMNWQGKAIVDLSREFLNTNGAVKHMDAALPLPPSMTDMFSHTFTGPDVPRDLRAVAKSLASASRRGLAERFDSTIGAGSVLLPFGGKTQRTPAQAMAALFPVPPDRETEDCSVMAWGFDPREMDFWTFDAAKGSVYLSIAKLVAAGADYKKAYLTFQEFFERLRDDPARWGKPCSALLGALQAQLELGIAAIGGKDSMSGSFNDLDVPPTLISFAIAPAKAGDLLSPEFKGADHPVYLFGSNNDDDRGACWTEFYTLAQAGMVLSAWATEQSLAEAVMKMSFGGRIGFTADEECCFPFYNSMVGTIVAELADDVELWCADRIGWTTAEPVIQLREDSAPVDELLELNEGVLERVYPNSTPENRMAIPVISAPSRAPAAPKLGIVRPKVLIPVFPGTNCEYDSARAVLRAGLDAEILVLCNQSADDVADSVERFVKAAKESQIIFVPGGFSAGDEPDGSGKFITAFFRNHAVTNATMALLKERDGLMLGICNGFQALIKLGLVPFGEIREADEGCPTLSYNVIGRHQSRIVRTRIASCSSPWLARRKVGDIVSVPISHGEGRFLCPPELLQKLADNGQIATQYVNLKGVPTMNIDGNPNGSDWAVEGILSPDGRVFGKMGHSERVGPSLYKNVPGDYDLGLFEAAKDYFA